MRPSIAILFALAASCCFADDFTDRFHEAEAKLGDLGEEGQGRRAELVVGLAEQDENRVARMLPGLDLDARSRATAILEDRGFYFDSKKTKRAREILEALSKPPPARKRELAPGGLGDPDPERRKLAEEFLALGPTSVTTLTRELAAFEVEPVPVVTRVVEVGAKSTCTFRMKNAGKRPLWFLPESAVARVRVQRFHFDSSGRGFPGRGFRGGLTVAPRIEESPEDRVLDLFALMTRVNPGEEFEFASVEIPTNRVGMALVATRPVRTDEFCGFDFPVEATFGDGSLTLVLPRPAEFPVARQYIMGARQESPYKVTAKYDGDLVRAGIEQTEEGHRSNVRPEYGWLIMERADGTVAGSGEFGESVLSEKEWKKGASATVDMGLPPLDGTRRIWVGFQVTGDDDSAWVPEPIEVNAK